MVFCDIYQITGMKEGLKDTLNTLFIGNIPEPFQNFPITFEDVFILIEKQEARNASELNYAQLIEDFSHLFKCKMDKDNFLRQPVGIKDIFDHQYINRKGLRSQYYKIIQDKSIHVLYKRELSCFCKNLFLTGSKIYGIDLLQDQASFVQELIDDEQKYTLLVDEYETLLRAIDETEENHPLSSTVIYWPHSIDQLNELSNKLYEAKFIDNPATFLQSFSNDIQLSKCNWFKSQRLLMYLISLFVEEYDNYKLMELCDFISDKFIFKGSISNSRTLRETLRNIEHKKQSALKFLSGDYAKLYTFYNNVIS